MLRYIFVFCSLSCAVLADEISHREAASALLAEIGGEKVMQSTFDAMIGPIEATWKQQGIPDHLIPMMTQALRDWLTNDFQWAELEPRLVDIYVRDFSESELNEILAFYRSPVGKKAIQALPRLMSEGAAIGQQYAQEKEPLLRARIEKVIRAMETPAPTQ